MRSQRNGHERARRNGLDGEKALARKRNGVSAAQRRRLEAEIDVPENLDELDDYDATQAPDELDNIDGDDVLEH